MKHKQGAKVKTWRQFLRQWRIEHKPIEEWRLDLSTEHPKAIKTPPSKYIMELTATVTSGYTWARVKAFFFNCLASPFIHVYVKRAK